MPKILSACILAEKVLILPENGRSNKRPVKRKYLDQLTCYFMVWRYPSPRQASSTVATSEASESISSSGSAAPASSSAAASVTATQEASSTTAVGTSVSESSAGITSSAGVTPSTSDVPTPSTSAVVSSSPSLSSADATTSSAPITQSTSTDAQTDSTLTTASTTSASSLPSTSPSASSASSSSSLASTTSVSASASSSSQSFPSSSSISSPTSQLWTTYTSSYVTVVSGTTITTNTAVPTLRTSPENADASNNRTAIIAGSIAGGAALLLLALSVAFYRRRKRFKYLGFLDAIDSRRKQRRARANLLAGEDLDNHHLQIPRYRDYETPWDDAQSPQSWVAGRESPPMIHRARGSESGSVFREDVWPPPTEGRRAADPLLAAAGSIDLSRIVDDVMGPSGAAGHFSKDSVSSSRRDLTASGYESDHERGGHSRSWSSDSQVALLEAAGLLESKKAQNSGDGNVEKQGRNTSPLKNDIGQ
ncbi:hypothetical protein BJ138DRAFT_1103407 [Hygrophoropsis aurantiaca]|uniref:Uncharacterized protein n=1 Tax=Hygrophoropsis aurantiaca TaxID=72124 RepID=A0ACB8A798_9AGAM|nr:hypothetical protein BJ138DRAFT_1103407 [Hygrophoropsis aurantiaca]